MGSKGDCYDNAVAESFFATFKKELVHLPLAGCERQNRDCLVEGTAVAETMASCVASKRSWPVSFVAAGCGIRRPDAGTLQR